MNARLLGRAFLIQLDDYRIFARVEDKIYVGAEFP
jgi:hypothetical protein